MERRDLLKALLVGVPTAAVLAGCGFKSGPREKVLFPESSVKIDNEAAARELVQKANSWMYWLVTEAGLLGKTTRLTDDEARRYGYEDNSFAGLLDDEGWTRPVRWTYEQEGGGFKVSMVYGEFQTGAVSVPEVAFSTEDSDSLHEYIVQGPYGRHSGLPFSGPDARVIMREVDKRTGGVKEAVFVVEADPSKGEKPFLEGTADSVVNALYDAMLQRGLVDQSNFESYRLTHGQA